MRGDSSERAAEAARSFRLAMRLKFDPLAHELVLQQHFDEFVPALTRHSCALPVNALDEQANDGTINPERLAMERTRYMFVATRPTGKDNPHDPDDVVMPVRIYVTDDRAYDEVRRRVRRQLQRPFVNMGAWDLTLVEMELLS